MGKAWGEALHLADITGDGTLDCVVGATHVDALRLNAPPNPGATKTSERRHVWNAGVIYLFSGDGGLAGTVRPSTILQVPGAKPGDQLGS